VSALQDLAQRLDEGGYPAPPSEEDLAMGEEVRRLLGDRYPEFDRRFGELIGPPWVLDIVAPPHPCPAQTALRAMGLLP